MSTNLNPASDPNKKKDQATKPGVLNKENPEKKNDSEEIQNEDTIINEQEQNQVVNSEDQDEYIDGAGINNSTAKSTSPEGKLKSNWGLNTNNPGENDEDDDDDDDDNEPERDIEIGDDPGETKKKIPVM